MSSEDLAARILIIYESHLPMDGRANLSDRMDAMHKAVEALGLHEVHGSKVVTVSIGCGSGTTHAPGAGAGGSSGTGAGGVSGRYVLSDGGGGGSVYDPLLMRMVPKSKS